MAPAHVALALLLLLAGSAPRAEAAKKVLCFGDSWAAFACDTLRDVLRVNLKDADVVDVGVAGSTAHFWATNPQDFLAVLAKAGSFDYMWLSTGGDDILGYYSSNQTQNVTENIYNDISTMMQLLATYTPNAQVVIFGYDFVNFDYSAECLLMKSKIFPNMTTYDINEVFLTYGAMLPRVVQRFGQLTYTPLWGTLQANSGGAVPPPYPNPYYPSPEQFMNDGCIHASREGWQILMSALYSAYFQSRL